MPEISPSIEAPPEGAVRYSLNQKQRLMAYGEVPISNNLAEDAVRLIVETAKVNGLEPYRYLRYILVCCHSPQAVNQSPAIRKCKRLRKLNTTQAIVQH